MLASRKCNVFQSRRHTRRKNGGWLVVDRENIVVFEETQQVSMICQSRDSNKTGLIFLFPIASKFKIDSDSLFVHTRKLSIVLFPITHHIPLDDGWQSHLW